MTTSTLIQDIHDLSLEMLLAGAGAESESIANALQKLAAFIENAAKAGANTIAANAKALLSSVGTAQKNRGAENAMTVLLEGLKDLEGTVASVNGAVAEPSGSASAGAEESLAEDPELLQDFVVEAREHLATIETQLLALEQNPGDSEPTHACFRAIHTIKGVAGFLELNAIREVAHEGETLLDELRNSRLAVTPALIDVLLQTADFLQGEVTAIADYLGGAPRRPASSHSALVERLRTAGRVSGAESTEKVELPSIQTAATEPAATVDAISEPAATITEPKSIPTAAVTAPSEVTAAAPVVPAASANSNAAAKTSGGAWQGGPGNRTVKIDMEKLDYLADMVGELVVTQSMLRPEGAGKASADTPLTRNLAQLARITAEVQKTTMSMRMVPIGQMFQRLGRLVRDVSRQIGKTVDLEISGEEIELDRSIVEELSDPLLHMVRNSIDHGIEPAAERKELGKNNNGRITLKAKHDAGHVQIEISDDGRGLDRKKILAKAKQRGLIGQNASLSDGEILNLIFEPGFSTAEKVTDLSGRGVGMDVVRKQVQKLRGRVDVRSTPGQGTTFVLRLPLTLAIIDGLVIGLGGEKYILPIAAVKEVLRPTEDMLFTVEGRDEMVMVRNGLMPLIRLSRWLGVTARSESLPEGILVVIESHGKAYCLAVDDLLGKQEVVIKSLGDLMQNVAGIAGGAILGDGRIGLILDTDAIAGVSAHE